MAMSGCWQTPWIYTVVSQNLTEKLPGVAGTNLRCLIMMGD